MVTFHFEGYRNEASSFDHKFLQQIMSTLHCYQLLDNNYYRLHVRLNLFDLRNVAFYNYRS